MISDPPEQGEEEKKEEKVVTDTQEQDKEKPTKRGEHVLPNTATSIYNFILAGFGLMLIGFVIYYISRRKRLE